MLGHFAITSLKFWLHAYEQGTDMLAKKANGQCKESFSATKLSYIQMSFAMYNSHQIVSFDLNMWICQYLNMCDIDAYLILAIFLISDVDECFSSPCQNEGICIDEINSFFCNCKINWFGLNCESMCWGSQSVIDIIIENRWLTHEILLIVASDI